MARPPLILSLFILPALLFIACSGAPGPEEQVQVRAFDAFQAMAHIEALTALGHRPAGWPQEREAARYVHMALLRYGYEVIELNFSFSPRVTRWAWLSVSASGEAPMRVAAMASWEGDVEGELIFSSQATTDRPFFIALVDSSEVERLETEIGRLAALGALAVVIYDHRGLMPWHLLVRKAMIAGVALPWEDAQLLLARMAEGPISVRLTFPPPAERTSTTVLGRPKGDRCRLLIGAHYDSVPLSPGANDNASGVGVVLELARVLAGSKGICFAFFGAEEEGLYGSTRLAAWMAQRGEAPEAVVVLDMVGLGDALITAGDAFLARELSQTGALVGVELSPGDLPPGTDSDHSPFLKMGIPAVLLHRPDDLSYHTPGDRKEKVQPHLLQEVGEAVLAWAKSKRPLLAPMTPGR